LFGERGRYLCVDTSRQLLFHFGRIGTRRRRKVIVDFSPPRGTNDDRLFNLDAIGRRPRRYINRLLGRGVILL
jgi:hypothetical protein